MTAAPHFPFTQQGWDGFRTSRNEELRRPHGWLSPVALHWIGETERSLPGLPGLWRSEKSVVHVRGAQDLTIRALPASAPAPVGNDASLVAGQSLSSEQSLRPGTWLTYGDLALELMLRDGYHFMRVRDPKSQTLTGFTGVPVFDYRQDWVIDGEFRPFPAVQTTKTGSVRSELSHDLSGIGVVSFRANGEEYSLTVVRSQTYPFNILFRDATSGRETSASVRQLLADAPEAGGTVVLDFNRAVNLPCSFTDFCTCPLPPPGNILPFAIEAGEKDPKGPAQ